MRRNATYEAEDQKFGDRDPIFPIDKAQDLLMLHGSAGLQTLDSIQLASALALKSDDLFCVTADDLLRIVMQKEGLNIVDRK